MDELGLSLNEAAEKSGLPADRLDLAVAQNYVAWHSFELTAIADALSCSIDYLCGREERRAITAEEVGRVWDLCMRHCQAWNMLSNDGHRWTIKFVNACHASPVEPELDLTEADAREIHDSQTPLGEYRWEHLSPSTRRRRLDIINAARRYRPPTRADKLVNACHVSPAEPEELTEAEARHAYTTLRPGYFCKWDLLTPKARAEEVSYINAARRYCPPSRADKLKAAIDLLGPDHPEAVAVLEEAAHADR
jgi:hypothetical protein